MATISHLATSISSTYHELLEILTEEIEKLAGTTTFTIELYRLLSELKYETTQERFKIIATDAVKLYKTLEDIFRTHIAGQLHLADKKALINILTRPGSCRTFLELLKEEEIIRLVTILIPQESQFIISYAHALDHQKEQGTLRGKGGPEFVKMKWQFIFPLMFKNRGSALNRKQFVHAVIKQIAAHYNLSYNELLIYFNEQKTLWQFDKELKEIVTTLYKEIITQPTNTRTDLRLEEQPEPIRFRKALSDPSRRRQLLETYSEEERQQLIRLLFKQESEFILAYASSLETQETTMRIEGKTAGNFRLLKWEFIWTVLLRNNNTVFNRRYFVTAVLQKLAAHYNLRYIELLGYFCMENSHQLFPVEIQTILHSLYQEQILQLTRQIGAIAGETTQHILLTRFISLSHNSTSVPGTIATFILAYLQFLNRCKEAGLLPHISDAAFRTILWEQIIRQLFSLGSKVKNLSKQTFIKQLLRQLAAYYQVPASELANEIRQKARQLTHSPADIRATGTQVKPDSLPVQISDSETNLGYSMLKQPYIDIPNAGVVLLAPWLPRLYTLLRLTDENRFKDPEAQLKAIYLIQYAIYEQTEFPEHELVLNKLLAGLDLNTPVPAAWELTEVEKSTTTSMLEGAKANWSQLKGSSVAALREAFLQREGRLEIREDHYKLTVEEKAYDLLLDHLPWNFRMIKQSWMEKRIEVKWR